MNSPNSMNNNNNNNDAEIVLNLPCRTVCAVPGAESRFLVGSCAVNGDENHCLHILNYSAERNELLLTVNAPLLSHNNGPIEALCSSPDDATLVCTAHSSGTLCLHKLPQDAFEENNEGMNDSNTALESSWMEQLFAMDTNGIVADICWGSTDDHHHHSGGDELLWITRTGHLTQLDVQSQQTIRTLPFEVSKTNITGPRIAWDPHANGHAVAVSTGARVHLLDWRSDTSIPTGTVDSFVAHRFNSTTCLNYNPNKPYVLATAGQDALLKFWDLRLTTKPLLVARGGHSHWISSVQYNPFHDQLVLTSGTDSVANLWRMSTISSAPLLTMEDDSKQHQDDANSESVASETAGLNARIARHEHVDGIYSACWSATDAWVYLTLGYDGKVQCHSVPSKEKYKILL